MRPVGNILDRLVRPGWQAEMNRRQHDLRGQRQAYAEQRPMQAAKQSALLTDSQLEALKQKALDGDEKAQQLLATYVRSLNPSRTGTSGPDWSQFQMGVAGRDTEGLAKPLGDGDDTTEPTLTGIRGNLTPAENLESVENQLSVAKEKLVRLEKELREGGKDMGPLNPRMRGKFKTYKEGELIEAEAEKTATENNIRNLEFTLETYRRPAAGAGGPTVAPR